MNEPFFCSQACRQRGEQIFGTASRVLCWLLFEHVGPWTRKSFPDDNIAPAVTRHISALAAQVGAAKRLVIRRHHRHDEMFRVFLVRSDERSPSASFLSFSTEREFLAQSPAELAARARPWTRPLFLVCTHGKHDKCCAKYGFPLYCAFRDIAPQNAWESSHVGGDRFAGNVVCMPEGIYYGNAAPEDADLIVAAHARGRVCMEYYRGRSCYARVVQAGEYFVRAESALDGIFDLQLLTSERIAAGCWRVSFASPANGATHVVEFLREDAGMHLLTCHAAEPKDVAQYKLLRYSRS